MNTQERWDYIRNNTEIIRQNMAQHDEEVRTKKLISFAGAYPKNMAIWHDSDMIRAGIFGCAVGILIGLVI